MNLDRLIRDYQTVAVVCNQWGDTGKGKIVDYLSERVDVIARGTAGANAGHTIVINGKELIFHLIPSGIVHDSYGKINIIGNGVAFDPRVAKEELKLLDENKISYNNLMISNNAKLVLPQHLVMDRIRETDSSKTKIGTTGRGVGPCYTDHTARIGLKVQYMLNKDVFNKKLKENLIEKVRLLQHVDPQLIKEVVNHEHLQNGAFYDPNSIFSIDAIVENYVNYGKFFKEMISDTDEFLQNEHGRVKILLEGAQGLLLSVDYGSYPFVTGCDCSIEGLSKGVGLNKGDVDLIIGMVKAFYMTRVGEGPFPTELGGKKSAEWCAEHTREDEEKRYKHVTVNTKEEFEQGVGIRFTGREFGATTGRPRRVGWLDLPLLRYAVKKNGPNVILSKVDVLDDCDKIRICDEYKYQGPEYCLGGGNVLRYGDRIKVAHLDAEILEHCKPVYREFPGWKSDIQGIRFYNSLPKSLKQIIDYIEEGVGVNVMAISVGAERDQIIIR